MTLAVRAAVSGRLDFSKANPDDPKWITWENIVMRQMEDDRYGEYLRASHLQDAAAIASVLPGKKGLVLYKHHSTQAIAKLTRFWNHSFPYQKIDVDPVDDMSEAAKLAERYKQLFSKK